MRSFIEFCGESKCAESIGRLIAENNRLRDALKHYVNVVESVNNPDDFTPKLRDIGHYARDALGDIDANA